MRKSLFLLAAILLTSCAGNNYNSTSSVDDWQGVNVNMLIQRKGPPSEKISLSSGRMLYIYRSQKYVRQVPVPPSIGIDPNGAPIVVNNVTNASPLALVCENRFAVNSKGMITGATSYGLCSD